MDFWKQWLQKLMCMFVSVKVWVLIAVFVAIFTGTTISVVAASIVTCILGIREAYKIWSPEKINGEADLKV